MNRKRFRWMIILGFGFSSGLGAKNTSHGYFQRMISNPKDEFEDMNGVCLSRVLPNLQTRNLAISGSTSIAHAEIVGEKLEVQPADIYGIVVSGNILCAVHPEFQQISISGRHDGASLLFFVSCV